MTTRLEIVRTIAAERDAVWTAWTDPDELAGWFWPDRFHSSCSIDLRVGGRWRIESAAVGMAVDGEFVAVEPSERLVMTWRWDGQDVETLVTVTFTDGVGGGTELRIIHENFAAEVEAESHSQGWNDCLDRLPAFVAAEPALPVGQDS